ncbi:hypothetical protein PRVXT_002213 [Proteinivorax tanatarense]|uniref:Bacterial transcription activator effector binding domain-containing protein n=1 Tax=Proteinivorax tanatarense TaxID=1260629 RepID=A0AAU7VK28_9FIRM
MENIYSEIAIVKVPKMKVAKYVVISSNPEQDAIFYMDKWAKESGLLKLKNYIPRRIGWDFPFVSKQQTEQYGLRGYVSAYIIPENFNAEYGKVSMDYFNEDIYATLTITDPHSSSFDKIPKGYEILMEFVNSGEYKTTTWENRIAFEEEYDKDGVHYMDVYIPVK